MVARGLRPANRRRLQFDADNVASIELICDGCGGHGHIRRVCPSNQARRRSIEYCIAGLQAKLAKKGLSADSRRPPGRGQRAPFQSQPRRYAPVRRADGSRAAPSTSSTSFSRRNEPPRRRALAAEEGEEHYEDLSAENDPERKESHMSVQELAPKQPVSFSDDSLYEDEKGLVMTEASGKGDMSYWSEDVSDGAIALPIRMVNMNDPSNTTEEYASRGVMCVRSPDLPSWGSDSADASRRCGRARHVVPFH